MSVKMVGKMDKNKRWWATGIFHNTTDSENNSVYTLDVLVTHFMGGEEIQELLRKEDKHRSELIKVIMTQGRYSPMKWWACAPAIKVKHKDGEPMLWGDGEGIDASSWPKERECFECLDGIMENQESCWVCESCGNTEG